MRYTVYMSNTQKRLLVASACVYTLAYIFELFMRYSG